MSDNMDVTQSGATATDTSWFQKVRADALRPGDMIVIGTSARNPHRIGRVTGYEIKEVPPKRRINVLLNNHTRYEYNDDEWVRIERAT